MIHIIDDYYIDGGARDYILLKDTGRADKDGNAIYKSISYHSSVSSAVENVRKIKCREITAEKNMELYEAVNAFKSIGMDLRKATEGLL